ncbi:hypothetical protein [Pseudonocardia spinosispora]|uniref:hypothetical protein n=1 Tax=Pseudonocardia spinosispora TaxID=103441 RepID=UPI0003F8DC45|nr:hypothetical protein [Pseudonocardia spinosispora]
MDTVWIDVSMWSGLSGKPQPYMDVECEVPDETPSDGPGWRDWAVEQLGHVATTDDWQPGRYHFTVEERDPSGRSHSPLAQGIWEWSTPRESGLPAL